MRCAFEPDTIGDLADITGVLKKELGGAFQAESKDQLCRGRLADLSHATEELGSTEREFGSEFRHREGSLKRITLKNLVKTKPEHVIHGRCSCQVRLAWEIGPLPRLREEPLPKPLSGRQQVADPKLQLLPGERLHKIVVGPPAQAFESTFLVGARGEQDDRYVSEFRIGMEFFAELEAVHVIHHDIAEQKVGYLPAGDFEGAVTLIRFEDVILVLQLLPDEVPHLRMVFHQEDHRSLQSRVGVELPWCLLDDSVIFVLVCRHQARKLYDEGRP